MPIECPKCHSENSNTVKFCGECGTPLESDVIHTQTLEAPTEELTTGSTFAGRYQIIEELGKGGMGRVYKANDTDIKEKVARILIGLAGQVGQDVRTINVNVEVLLTSLVTLQ